MEREDFSIFFQALCNGDSAAVASLLEELRSVARKHLADERARRLYDSADVCQSVFAIFFPAVKAGRFTVDSWDALLGLLSTMVRHRAYDKLRQAAVRRHGGSIPDGCERADDGGLVQIILRDSVARALGELSSEERRPLELHFLAGLSWQEVASQTGGTPASVQVACSRLCQRLAKGLGEDE